MYANHHYLAFEDEDGVIFGMAMDTATHNERGVTNDQMLARIEAILEERLVPFPQLAASNPGLAELARQAARAARTANRLFMKIQLPGSAK